MQKSAAGKERQPNAVSSIWNLTRQSFIYVQVFTGGEAEMITEGGETRFVGQMVTESLVIRERCQ